MAVRLAARPVIFWVTIAAIATAAKLNAVMEFEQFGGKVDDEGNVFFGADFGSFRAGVTAVS